jgi:peptidoglycan/xylan/chitin deacetylase (PgdA/CDA1 family)
VAGYRALVLCYHAVSEEWPHLLSTPRDVFEKQLARLLRGRRALTVEQAVAGEPGLHVTFDDAFRSVERALPVLERLGAPATVFACPGLTGAKLDVPELADSVREHPAELETMGWDDLRGLAERGLELGSHTLSHPHLPALADDELRRELEESKARLEDELGRPCRYLAYPFGDEEERVRGAARRAGYDAAFALPGREDRIDRFALPRVGVYRGDSGLRLALKTTGAVRRPAAAVLRALGRRRG